MTVTEYRTPAGPVTAELTEKRSRFIASMTPVADAAAASEFIASVKSEHRDARHNVYAYALKDGRTIRYSDDGEPQGTAGQPILKVISSFDVCDCAIVVTRYFGGILLGTGGLQRAYSAAARLSLERAEIVHMKLHRRAVISCGYELYGSIASLIGGCGGIINDSVFAESVQIDVSIPHDLAEHFAKQVYSATSGGIMPEYAGEVYCRVSV